ncbi:hypothetical protein COHA_007837 [Chlorella ohadii]|uniref:Uncharacterized protein n=1 Tax=Chlorella ohadii TaxID=2649997 RepID=A0AAD5DME7_9CHLO|nr:hypothetical protein COHA_007837 [Chlorella ohadii]
MLQVAALKSALRAPEGKWAASSERRATINYSPDLPVQLSLAVLHDDGDEAPTEFLIFSAQNFLHICYPAALDREPLRFLDFRHLGGPTAAGPVFPTCHAHTPVCRDEFDLAVGLSTGEVVLLSLRAQLRAPPTSTRPITSLSFNPDGSSNASRCVALAWLPGTEGTALVVAHRNGVVLLYHKVLGSSSEPRLLARTSSQQAMKPAVTQLQGPGAGGGVNAAAVAPDGLHIAVACKDGVLRVYALPSGGLVAGFKSYYGGLHCCAWSPDGRYVAAGGEDDLVAIYGLAERCVVAYCQGHHSWVSGLAFDPWAPGWVHGDTPEQQQQPQPPEQPVQQQSEQQQQEQQEQPEPQQAEQAQQQGQQGQQAAGALAPGGERDRVYRLASMGQDCQLALWDIVVTEESVAAAQQASSVNNSPERERPGLPLPHKRRGRSSSPSKRLAHAQGHSSSGAESSRGSGMFRTRSSASSASAATAADPGALPAALATGLISPPLPRADWQLVTPVAQGRVHPEPCSSLVYSPQALYTACHGACLRRWARPQPGQQPAPAGPAAVQRPTSSVRSGRHSVDR